MRSMIANSTPKSFLLVRSGHPSKYRYLTSAFVCISRIVLDADTALFFHADDVVAERIPLCSVDCGVSFFIDTDHFTMVLDHAWDISKRMRCIAGAPISLCDPSA